MKLVRTLPDTYFDNYAEDCDGDDKSYSANWKDYGFNRFTDYLKLLSRSYTSPPRTCFETGSADGSVIKELCGMGIETCGVEINKYILIKCVDKNVRSKIARADASELVKVLPDNSFDCVYETCVEYLNPKKVESYLKNIRRISKRDIVFLLHTKESEQQHTGQVTYLSNGEWLELLSGLGFVPGHVSSKVDSVPFFFRKA